MAAQDYAFAMIDAAVKGTIAISSGLSLPTRLTIKGVELVCFVLFVVLSVIEWI